MQEVPAWLQEHWPALAISAGTFLFALVVLASLRWRLMRLARRQLVRATWTAPESLLGRLRVPSLLLIVLAAAGLALVGAPISPAWKGVGGRIAGSIGTVVLAYAAAGFMRTTFIAWAESSRLPGRITQPVTFAVGAVLILGVVLIILGIWGVSATPVALVFAVVLIGVIVGMRHALTGWASYMLFTANQPARVGERVRLDSGVEGMVVRISWNAVQLRAADGSQVRVPLDRFMNSTITNLGRPLPKMQQQAFYRAVEHIGPSPLPADRSELRQWLADRSLRDVYWELFGIWVRDGLGDAELATQFARIDPERFTLESLRSVLLDSVDRLLPERQRTGT